MLRRIRRLLPTTILVLIILLLVGCSRTFVVKVEGTLDELYFRFYKSFTEINVSEFNIVELVVQKELENGKWVVVWELNGKQALKEIKYGNRPNKLDEVVTPTPLEKGPKYRVLVSETSFANPKGFAGNTFFFNEYGELISEETSRK